MSGDGAGLGEPAPSSCLSERLCEEPSVDDDQQEGSAYVIAGSTVVALVVAAAALAMVGVALDVTVGGGLIAASLGAVLGAW